MFWIMLKTDLNNSTWDIFNRNIYFSTFPKNGKHKLSRKHNTLIIKTNYQLSKVIMERSRRDLNSDRRIQSPEC